jgi:phospholipid-binding lipoprotein MlaA
MAVIATSWAQQLGKLMVCAGLVMLPALSQAASEDDPWESFNRPIFVFNDTLDVYALKPLAQGYQAITPQFLEDGIHNMFSNVGEVGNLANDLLQGKIHAAGVDTSRLIFNTTFGLLGFFDVANKMDLRRSDEDFGQTFGAWGVSSGPYLVLPAGALSVYFRCSRPQQHSCFECG